MGWRNKNGIKHRGQDRRTLPSQKRLVYSYWLTPKGVVEVEKGQEAYLITEKGKEVLQDKARRA